MGSFEIYHGFTILRVIFSTLLSARVDHVKRHLCQLLEFEIVWKILILHLWLRFPLNETSLKIVLKRLLSHHWMRFPLNETPLTSLQQKQKHLEWPADSSRFPSLEFSWGQFSIILLGSKSSIFYHFPGGSNPLIWGGDPGVKITPSSISSYKYIFILIVINIRHPYILQKSQMTRARALTEGQIARQGRETGLVSGHLVQWYSSTI